MTDVTGFGLLGHLHELALASGVSARVEAAAVPAIEGVLELLAAAMRVAGGSRRNREWRRPSRAFADGVPERARALLCDAMTSGGLLVAAPQRERRRPQMERGAADGRAAASAAHRRPASRPRRPDRARLGSEPPRLEVR